MNERGVHREFHLNAPLRAMALKAFGIVEGGSSCCFLSIFATWLPAAAREREAEKETQGMERLCFLNGFRPLAFQQ